MAEYERTSTVAMNAYASPMLGTYLRGLREACRKRGFRQRVHLMQSQGGLIGAEEAERVPCSLSCRVQSAVTSVAAS